MAITDNAIPIAALPLDGQDWSVSAYSADLSGAESLKAAVTGSYHYVTKIIIACVSNITVSIGGGETASALTNTYIGPVPFNTGGSPFVWEAPKGKGMKLLISTALCTDASGAGATAIYVEGKTGS